MTKSDEHPDPAKLEAFALGKLDADQISQVSQHIESCESCTRFLDGSFKDTILENLAKFDDVEATSENENGPSSSSPRSFFEMQELFRSASKYQLLKELGSGGMGAVYLAEHTVMGRQVAIKVIREEWVSDQDAVARFHQEVKAAAQLSHRNIVTAHDADQVGDVHFLVMEFVEGESLADLVRRKGRLPVVHSCNFVSQAASGLSHAHQLNMVHRDIKPHNLMRTSKGVVKVLDFGLARLNGPEEHKSELTASGILMGTADYIAPEQARDARAADVRSDLYSLGCTFYFLLAGHPPYREGGYVEKVIAHCSNPFPDIGETRDDVPEPVKKILQKLTTRDPGQRYQSPRQLIDDLAPFARKNTPPAKSGIADKIDTVPANPPSLESVPIDPLFAQSDLPASPVVPADARNRKSTQVAWRIPSGSKWIIGSVAALVLLVAGIWAMSGLTGFGNRQGGEQNSNTASISDDQIKTGKGQGKAVEPNRNSGPHVLIVLSADKFWFSDYGPIEAVFRERGIRWTVTSNRIGNARFDPSDSMEGKHVVSVDKDVQQIASENELSGFDAVVFMGNSVEEFIQRDETGSSIELIISELQRNNRWLASIGRGSNIPAWHGKFDGTRVANSQWILPQALERSNAELVNDSLVTDMDSHTITAGSWHDATVFANEIASQLLKDQSNR